jgi:hypothetical protein
MYTSSSPLRHRLWSWSSLVVSGLVLTLAVLALVGLRMSKDEGLGIVAAWLVTIAVLCSSAIAWVRALGGVVLGRNLHAARVRKDGIMLRSGGPKNREVRLPYSRIRSVTHRSFGGFGYLDLIQGGREHAHARHVRVALDRDTARSCQLYILSRIERASKRPPAPDHVAASLARGGATTSEWAHALSQLGKSYRVAELPERELREIAEGQVGTEEEQAAATFLLEQRGIRVATDDAPEVTLELMQHARKLQN